MSIKGAIDADHIPLNKYKLVVVGLPEITFTKVSGMEVELEAVDLPDRTRASGGQTKAVEFTATVPLHHVTEMAAMELWFTQSQDPVAPGYKKAATLQRTSVSGAIIAQRSLVGVFPTKRKDPDNEMANEGELAEVEWTLSVDEVI
jgi:hypothetical protein